LGLKKAQRLFAPRRPGLQSAGLSPAQIGIPLK
jgi:hypothetical protein